MYKSRAPKDESDGRLSNTERVKNLSKSRRNIQNLTANWSGLFYIIQIRKKSLSDQ